MHPNGLNIIALQKKISRKFNLLKIIITCFFFSMFLPIFASAEETYVFERMWPTLQQPWYFKPFDIAMDANQNIYITDASKETVIKLNSEGQLITEWKSGYEFVLPWAPRGIAIGDNQYVYVADTRNDCIQKFTLDAQFITHWGSSGAGDGQFEFSDYETETDGGHIAIDSVGNVYVADTLNHRIQKFTSDGRFITKWGTYGTDNGQFNAPAALTIDVSGNVYVVDGYNDRIQKFTSDGVFVKKWGSHGDEPGQFNFWKTPQDEHLGGAGITIDNEGYIVVVDVRNYRIQKFDPDGNFFSMWGNIFTFDHVGGIVIDDSNNIYVTNQGSKQILKFTSDGTLITQWGSSGSNNDEFSRPLGIGIDSSGHVYVADTSNFRIQKFTSDGRFIDQLTVSGDNYWEPWGMAVDGGGNVYAVGPGVLCPIEECAHSVKKYNANGELVTEWGGYGSGPGEFIIKEKPTDIAIDGKGNVYVIDTGNNRIQKFTSSGDFIKAWGTYGTNPGQFDFEVNYGAGIAIDPISNFVYVVGGGKGRVQKFDLDGNPLHEWNKFGEGAGEVFGSIHAVTVDTNGDVFVDLAYPPPGYSGVIRKFTANGDLIASYLEPGSEPGQLNRPHDMIIDPNGKLYVADSTNNRVQVFKKVDAISNSKAIVIAGGGPYSGNNLWDATQMCANFAYRTLTYQGFTKDSIYYLTADIDLDLDNNGELDDVDDDATNTNLQQAVTSWASNAGSLVLYLVDHGGNGTFRMSGTETLSASDLDSWLDTLQATMSGRVIVVYDACESGSFLSALKPSALKERVVIASTSSGESAYFVSQGTVSFSNYFWTHVFNGLDVKDAFSLAERAVKNTTNYQHPLIDANGNGIGNEGEDYTLAQNTYIGNGTIIHGDAPVIGMIAAPQTITNTTSALLSASSVTDNDGVARVWATIRPPDYSQGSSDNPVQNLPSTDLMPAENDRYEVTYDGFNIAGTYHVTIYARDRIGNASIPRMTTVSVENPLKRRAMIVAGGSPSDSLWPAVEVCAGFAYEALIFQGYTDDDIYFMSPITFSSGVDVLPTLSNLNYAVNTWAQNNTQDVVLYMVGEGGLETFQINETETLLSRDLDAWIDNLQQVISGKVTVIYDADRSGSFLSSLVPPGNSERIVVSSTDLDGPAYFAIDGSISFSAYFWQQVLNGANVRDAFVYTTNAIGYAYQGQEPMLDDSGNGLGNEQGVDGRLAREYTIGAGILLAGDDPLIGSVSPARVLTGETSATIWVDHVTTTGAIDKVWALIAPPDGIMNPLEDIQTLELSSVGNGRYEGTYCCFISSGTYKVSIYAMDHNGNVSLPKDTQVDQTIGSDIDKANDTYFPHVASNSTWETEVCVINTSDKKCFCGELTAYNDSGQPVASRFISLTPKARREMIIGHEFSNSSEIGYMLLDSDLENVKGYTKFYIEGKYRVAIPAASNVNTSDIYISHIASDLNWTTGISILNTTSSSKDLFIDFDNGTTRAIHMAANEHQAFTIRQLFNDDIQPNINSAVIKNGSGIVGLEIFGTTESSGLSFLSGILLKDDTAINIYYPHIASDSTWGTGVVAYNPSTTSCDLTITPFKDDGTQLSSQTKTLAAQEKYIGTIEELSLPDQTAWFSILSSRPITGFELFSTKDGKQLGGYTGVGISGTEGIFAKIDKTGGTGIAFVNIENFPATVTITAYDNSGNAIATETLNMSANEKVVGVPSSLFSKDISTATYMAYSSDGQVVGFQLNVSFDGMMMDALPGM